MSKRGRMHEVYNPEAEARREAEAEEKTRQGMRKNIAADMNALTPEQLQRRRETVRRHDMSPEKSTHKRPRRVLGDQAIRDSQNQV